MISPQTEREILIAVDSKLSSLVEIVNDVRDQLNHRASIESVSGLEVRIRHTERRVGAVERKFWMASGVFAAVMFLLKLLPGVLK